MTDSTRRRFLRRATTGVTTTAIVGLAGCAGFRSEDDRTTPIDYSLPEATPNADVRMGPNATNRYDPGIVHVEVGGTVTWTNVSGNHSATAYAPANDRSRRIPADAEAWDTGVLIENGGSASHTFEVPGVYDYYCIPHERFGMIASVIVGSPDPADQPGLRPPGDGLSGEAASKIELLNAKVRSALDG